MKRAYVRPTMVGERFVANEYVAACWKIKCNVPEGYGYIDNNGNGRFNPGDKLLTSKSSIVNGVHGCNKWHTGVKGVPGDGPEPNAMWHPFSWFGTEKDYRVYYWRDGNGENDVHFSKVEDAEWETNPNAS